MCAKGTKYKNILLLTIFLLACVQSAFATDELFLSGKIISVDPKAGTVLVDVKSTGCKGQRNFIVENMSDFQNLINKNASFFISSTRCEYGRVYKITKLSTRGIKK